eukprot:1595409-Rhodomonas_salina.1
MPRTFPFNPHRGCQCAPSHRATCTISECPRRSRDETVSAAISPPSMLSWSPTDDQVAPSKAASVRMLRVPI